MGYKILNKKGAMTAKMLITVILLILSFVMVIVVYAQFFSETDIDSQVCHESVILRGSISDTFKFKDTIPLKCKTNRICVTSKLFGKGECELDLGTTYDTIRVTSNVDKMHSAINTVLAREIADCWAMMAEGKVQVFSRDSNWRNSQKCSICSRIAFDKTITDKINQIEGLGKYLITHKVPNKDVSYWEFLGNGISARGYNVSKDVYSLDEKAIVFMEIGLSKLSNWIGLFTGVAGGCWIGGKTGGVLGSIIPGAGTFVGAIAGCIGGAVVGGVVGDVVGEEVAGDIFDSDNLLKGAEYAVGYFFTDYGSAIRNLNCDKLENIA